MKPRPTTHAYIDAANLYKGVKSLGWKLDYRRFRVWLADKYGVGEAYLFIGMIPKYAKLYTELQAAGFKLVFKEVVYDHAGVPKGNCDADLVVQAMRECYLGRCQGAVIVASDGDYASLVGELLGQNKLLAIISPSNVMKCSILLKKTGAPIVYLNDVRRRIGNHTNSKRAPGADGTAQGSLLW
jgi:uncharacterized LabA/DUF88 family protein